MSEPVGQAFTVATDEVIAEMIRQAATRLVFVAPAVWSTTATALCEQIERKRLKSLTLVLDSDPEVYRLGYGDLAALEQVQAAAQARGVELRCQPGVRIGLLIADDETLIFTPTPRLVEAGINTHGAANAIRLGAPPAAIESDLGITGGNEPKLGRSSLTPADIQTVKSDLNVNPPQKFDLTRQVRVFNSFIEFVELRVSGTDLARRTVRIPNHLLAAADAQTRQRLRTSYSLVPADDELTGASVDRDRRLLTSRYLTNIPNYGTVVLRTNKDRLSKAVEQLTVAVEQFSRLVQSKIQQRIDKVISELMSALLARLVETPPEEWRLSTGAGPEPDQVREYLEEDLRCAFGDAAAFVSGMKVKCVYKGVTYDQLCDPEFVEAVTQAIPAMKHLHEEYGAAREVPAVPIPE